MDSMSRETLVEGLAVASGRWSREELEDMDDGRLAACANASSASPEEIRSAAEGGAIARRRADFSALAANRRDGPRADFSGVGGPNRGGSAGGGVETVNVMSGPQGTAAIDRVEEATVENDSGDGGPGFETRRIMSGPRGTAAVDDD